VTDPETFRGYVLAPIDNPDPDAPILAVLAAADAAEPRIVRAATGRCMSAGWGPREPVPRRPKGDVTATCDCREDEGAVHLTLVMNPSRRSGSVTVGHTRFSVEAAVEALLTDDDLSPWQPQWLSEAQAGLLRQLVEDLYYVPDDEDDDATSGPDPRGSCPTTRYRRAVEPTAEQRTTHEVQAVIT
jgi:hypothetical protein